MLSSVTVQGQKCVRVLLVHHYVLEMDEAVIAALFLGLCRHTVAELLLEIGTGHDIRLHPVVLVHILRGVVHRLEGILIDLDLFRVLDLLFVVVLPVVLVADAHRVMREVEQAIVVDDHAAGALTL